MFSRKGTEGKAYMLIASGIPGNWGWKKEGGLRRDGSSTFSHLADLTPWVSRGLIGGTVSRSEGDWGWGPGLTLWIWVNTQHSTGQFSFAPLRSTQLDPLWSESHMTVRCNPSSPQEKWKWTLNSHGQLSPAGGTAGCCTGLCSQPSCSWYLLWPLLHPSGTVPTPSQAWWWVCLPVRLMK
jgi:hypothetical protein